MLNTRTRVVLLVGVGVGSGVPPWLQSMFTVVSAASQHPSEADRAGPDRA